MRSPKLPLAALIALFLLTSCASYRPPVSAPPPPLPAEYVALCPPPVAPQGHEVDDVARTLKVLYDQYGLCAGRMADLLDWLEGAPTPAQPAR